jgi:diguanylate cyclase (GGDEF)-like protein/PAS domain S-box-containing protein
MPIGLGMVDQSYQFVLVNKAFCDMIGYDKKELENMTPFDITHRDDWEKSQDQLILLTEGKIDSYQTEKRYIHKDGNIVWVNLTTSLLRDAQGRPSSFIGQVQDITQRRIAEEKLHLAATVYNYSNEAMMITDTENRIVATNPAFTALTGYSAEEVLGGNPRMLGSGRHDAAFYQAMWEILSTENHWEGDVWNRKKSGEIYAEWLSISIVRNSQGAVQNYVALFSDVTEQKKADEQVWEHANYDPLTLLPNRRLFEDRLSQAIKQADRSGELLALLIIDLDYFKEVNDSLGHQAGDELLIQVANRISTKVRHSDTVARLGGDEFTAILCNTSNIVDIERIAQSIVNILNEPFKIGTTDVHISGSIGISIYPKDTNDKQKLIKYADEAMYLAKRLGRNRFVYNQNKTVDVEPAAS